MDRTAVYLQNRIDDYLDTKSKSDNAEDIKWLNVLIQELDWTLQIHMDQYHSGCFMERYDDRTSG